MPIDQLDTVERYLLLLLYAPDHTDQFARPVRGRTWLQKEMFLLSKLTGELEEKTEYDPNIMGSYSQIVDEVEDQFYISEYEERIGDAMKLSLEGKKLAEEVWMQASDREKRIVASVKALLNDMSQLELLGFIYTEYPETAVNSEKRAEVEARRLEIAISLFQKGKVPLEKAAQVAKQSTDVFLQELKKRGVDLSEVETKNVLSDRGLLEEIEQSKEESKQGRLVPWEAIRNSP
jgi:predicted HTH domain antitoxin